jgi:predicted Zn-dependent protease
MAEDILKDFRDDYALLIEAGFVAVKQLDENGARYLFKAAELLRPENVASQLGVGYIALNKLKINEATKIFSDILKKEPEHHLAQALLGICYMLTKNKLKEGQKLIQDAKSKSDEPTIKTLADICMVWAEKDLAVKATSPLMPAKADD